MPYTLAKFFLWGLLMALAGGIVGWLLRSLKARTDLDRRQTVPVDSVRIRPCAQRTRIGSWPNEIGCAWNSPTSGGAAAGALGFASAAPRLNLEPVAPVEPVEVTKLADVDLDAARAVLGKRIALDDLRVVEGIGPKIAELCAGIGVMTWQQLAESDTEHPAGDARCGRVAIQNAPAGVVAAASGAPHEWAVGRVCRSD